MQNLNVHTLPRDGFAGLLEHWRNDLIAGFSVALVALPLGLGIAVAAGAPPISGILSAILGGLLTTFIRSSKISINGPGNVMIVLIFSALGLLDGDFNQVLAAIAISGLIMMIMGLLKLGRFGEILPASVIQGLLAAIGLLIVGKQIYVALGTSSIAKNSVDMLKEIPLAFLDANPFVAFIALVSLAVLVVHPKFKSKLIHFVPAPIWVVSVAIPLVYVFNFIHPHTYRLLGHSYHIGPEMLMDLPDKFFSALMWPDFSGIGKPAFWGVVFTLALVNTIETLVSTSAIDKLDPFKRKTDLNRDLFAVGLTTLTAGCIGALPVGTVIMRSSINVNHGAKTRWSSFFHGLILLICVLFLGPIIRAIPLSALAALLVFSGYKLTSLRVYQDAWRKGPEQFLIVLGTLVATLYTGLLNGIVIGMLLTLAFHIFKSRMPPNIFVQHLLKPSIQTIQEKQNRYLINVSGVCNFLTILSLNKALTKVPEGFSIDVDFSKSHLVDLTVMEFIEEYADKYRQNGGDFHILGLDMHQSGSDHPYAMRILIPPHKIYSLTRRQRELKALCEEKQWKYEPQIKWGPSRATQSFQFFDTRPVEYRSNIIRGEYPESNVTWAVADLTFDEGALLATEVYRTTVQVIHLPYRIPVFTMENEELLDKILQLTGYKDVDLNIFTDFSRKFVLKGLNKDSIHGFFTPRIVSFFESEEVYHLESNGEALFIFKYLRLASPQDVGKMVHFGERLLRKLNSFTAQLPRIEEHMVNLPDYQEIDTQDFNSADAE